MNRTAALLALAISIASMDAPAMATEAKTRLNVAFVLLSEAAMPKAEDLVRAYASFAGKDDHVRVSKSKTAKTEKTPILQLDFSPSAFAMIMLVPMPVPKQEVEEAVRFSVSSLASGWKLPPHKAQLIVTSSEPIGTPAIDALSRFTSVVAAVTEASHAVAVYWGAGSATHDPKFLISTAHERGTMPRITLWVGVSQAREADGRVSLLSLGMKQLGLPDLLLTGPPGAFSEALECFYDLLAYLADLGKPIGDGETVGRTATEKWPVHYVPSPIDAKQKVWRVDMK